jgi:pilus assembly protein CpaE
MKIAQAIPTSPEVANATNAGDPITSSHPKHPVSLALSRLAESVSGGTAAGDGSAPRGTERSERAAGTQKRGLLRRGR